MRVRAIGKTNRYAEPSPNSISIRLSISNEVFVVVVVVIVVVDDIGVRICSTRINIDENNILYQNQVNFVASSSR